MDEISKELVGASAGTFVLAVLANGESYGYEIVQKIKKLSKKPITWKEAGIYPILKRFEAEGYIKSNWKMIKGQRPRKYYALNKKGRIALQAGKEDWESIYHIYNQLWAPLKSLT